MKKLSKTSETLQYRHYIDNLHNSKSSKSGNHGTKYKPESKKNIILNISNPQCKQEYKLKSCLSIHKLPLSPS